ncbi:MAG: mannosyltransferase family protein [Anaerolineae bacterium]
MLKSHPYRTLTLIWLAWAIVLLSFQGIVNARYQPNRPDRALEWTPSETSKRSQAGKDFLTEPFMNHQVAWDSEFYLGIAVGGYDDPRITTGNLRAGGTLPLSYAFFPLYPAAISVLATPLRLLNLNPIAAATLGGVLVSLLGTLAAMMALYELTRDELGEEGGIRTAFYLLIFPSGFFLAQVYTEGLFVGLAFGCLALIHRQHLFWAAVLAALATLTKGIGIALILPLAWHWFTHVDRRTLRQRFSIRSVNLETAALILLPIAAYLAWHFTLGDKAFLIERDHFGRGLLNWSQFSRGVGVMFNSFRDGSNPQMTTYYALEAASVIIMVVSCLFTFRHYPGLTCYCVVAILLPVTGSAPQSIIRYVLAVPAVFIMLARFGRNPVFDRGWTMFSLLLMGMLVSLYTFDMWVA